MYNGALGGSLFYIIGVSIGVYVQDRLLSLCLSPKGLKRYFETKDSSGNHP